ncbi:hypothetical protein Cgig2_001399 [Carnegiea gigantea]|uniref:3'-5' exonuclease domain-containing protein n=1 Tax=Carnegiea gigantea TaxID=171969 RepID=A0A9Q1QNX8_9CARY|nr:hypothetical protein Cgig2_001399 [Carnegiea gigantea]
MATSITHATCCDCRQVFDVTFFGHSIEVAVTSMPEFVGAWIANIENMHHRRIRRGGLIVGLDVEWRPNFRPNSPQNPVSLLQLCVGHMCLVFQLQYASELPQSLADFLGNDDYTFVGVGIAGDAQRLYDDCGLVVSNGVDLCFLAADSPGLRNAGLTALAKEVLDVDYNKPRTITMSNWAKEQLSDAQIQYACIDAFLSFEIGRCLGAANR